MNSMKSALLLIAIAILFAFSASAQEINTSLMESTFKIEGKSETPNAYSSGTVFILGRPHKDQPEKGDYVLITAAHVLEEITKDTATLYLRTKNPDQSFATLPVEIKIRNNGIPLWTRHPDKNIDVACLYIALPDKAYIRLISTDFLATDEMMKQYEIHPGDELFCLGYPKGVFANSAGFPVLRSGKIASYPLIPAKTIKTFLFDFSVFPGNSGGPVYFTTAARLYQNGNYNVQNVRMIVGLVSQQAFATTDPSEPLRLAIIVPAEFIAETLALMPDRSNF